MKLTNREEILAWIQFYSAIVGWHYHPGNINKNLSLRDAAATADEMIDNLRDRTEPE